MSTEERDYLREILQRITRVEESGKQCRKDNEDLKKEVQELRRLMMRIAIAGGSAVAAGGAPSLISILGLG